MGKSFVVPGLKIFLVFLMMLMCMALTITYAIVHSRSSETGSVVTWTIASVLLFIWFFLLVFRSIVTYRSKRRLYINLDEQSKYYSGYHSRFKILAAVLLNIIRWIFVFIAWTLIVFVLLLFLFNNAVWRAFYAIQFPAPGKCFSLEKGPKLHIYCEGGNRSDISQVTVVLETELSVPASMSWSLLFPLLSNKTRTCWYDRAGYGWSQSGDLPREGFTIATELLFLLHKSKELENGKQIVLVGNGWGGQLIRTFQALYSRHVAGLVFIDSLPDNITSMNAGIEDKDYEQAIHEYSISTSKIAFTSIIEPFGFTRKLYKYKSYYSSQYEANKGGCKVLCPSGVGASSIFNNRWSLAVWGEKYYSSYTEQFLKNSTDWSNYSPPLGDLPIGIVTAGASINGSCDLGGFAKILLEMKLIDNYQTYCREYEKRIEILGPMHYQAQEVLSKLSSDSIWTIFWNSRHMIQWDYPVELADKIMEIVQKAEEWIEGEV
jgi:hypothetical protein